MSSYTSYFIVGDISITSVLLKKLQAYGISIFFMNYNLEVKTYVCTNAEGNYLLREKQYKICNDLDIAKHILINKITNQTRLINKISPAGTPELQKISEKIYASKNHQELLGLEGSFSKIYFSKVFCDIDWKNRLPRTKHDIPNYLLDLGYTVLFNIIDAELRLFGFDTYKGFYHKLYFQRKSLTCDIIEPFRIIIDKKLISSYHLKQIDHKDFKLINGRYYLEFDKSQKYVQIFTQAILNHKKDIYEYIYEFYKNIFNEKINYPIYKIKL